MEVLPEASPTVKSSKILRLLPVLLAGILLAFTYHWLSHELTAHSLAQIWQSFRSIPQSSILLALSLTLLNYGVLSGYDTLAVRYARRPLTYGRTALVAMIGYAFSNNFGFTVLSGGAIRYRFYRRWGLSVGAIAQTILFCNLSFWVGLLTLGGALFLWDPFSVAVLLRLPLETVRSLGGCFLSLVLAYLGWCLLSVRPLRLRQWVLPPLSLRLALGQMGVTLADWMIVAAVLYVLLPGTLLPSYPSFLGIYSLAKVAAVMSHVPGGLGVFETVVLSAIAPPAQAMPKVLSVFLAYRGIYYLLPLAIAILVWTSYELKLGKPEK